MKFPGAETGAGNGMVPESRLQERSPSADANIGIIIRGVNLGLCQNH
jgi:hypothetical protein